jgi:hypothetical protein
VLELLHIHTMRALGVLLALCVLLPNGKLNGTVPIGISSLDVLRA